jgi:hypothetical protein
MAIFLKASTKRLNTPCDYNRMTPLHAAVARGHCSTVAILTEYGADVNAVDSDGKTPLHYAAKRHHYKCLMVRRPCRTRAQPPTSPAVGLLSAAASIWCPRLNIHSRRLASRST